MAPAHWPLEVVNGLRSAQRRGRLDLQKLVTARSVLTPLPVTVAAIDLDGALDLAREHDLTPYDAAYLDLARSRGMGLATSDERLAAVCLTVGVPLVA